MNSEATDRERPGVRVFFRALFCLALAVTCQGSLSAATLPAGFSESTINGPAGSAWNQAVGIHFEPNGRMYVWERNGRVYFKEQGSSSWTLLIDITEEVGGWRDFGLLGFALDPNFRANGYIYLLYVVDRHHLMHFGTPNYNPGSDEYFNATIGRVTRYTARAADGFASVDNTSRRILLGESRSTGIPILHQSHGVGSLVFGTDGTLLISCGDAASYTSTDIGNASETYYAQALTDGIIKPKENVGSYRSQLVDSLNGKILRLDPATGDGVPSNPFYDATNPRAPRSRVWALGLRNPYRMTLRPESGSHHPADGNPGVLYIGEVGWNVWEEMNACTGPGQNFGWPAFEGIEVSSDYYQANVQNLDAPNPLYPGAGCSQYFYFRDLIKQNTTVVANQPPFNNPCNSGQKIPTTIPQFLHTPPSLDWQHGVTRARTWIYDGSGVASAIDLGASGSPVSGAMFPGNCSVGGTWYEANDFPAQYRNTYFHADFGANWIRNFVFDGNNKPTAVRTFLSGGGPIVAVATHPLEGGLFYLTFTSESAAALRRISYATSGNLPPIVTASADPTYGPGPLTVQFSGSASTDPEGLPLTYTWNFGDGTATSTAANPVHTFNAPAGVPTPYTVALTVRDSANQTATASLVVSVNNTPPAVNITSPIHGSKYSMAQGSMLDLAADVLDNESTDGQLQYKWQTFLHHNNHEHGDPIDTNHATAAVVSPIGCDGVNVYYYRIQLTVTDPAGLSTTREASIFPECQPPDSPPVISDIPDQLTWKGYTVGPLVFTVGDADVAAGNLEVRAASSNPTLVPNNRIVLGGSGANRMLTLTPAAGSFPGTATISVTVNDGPHNVSEAFVLTVQPGGPPISITTTSLPNGVVNISYTAALGATGGTLPYTWSLASGSLPAGLALGGNGAITGTPTISGTSDFTARVSDASDPIQSITRNLSIMIASAPLTVGNTNEGTVLDTIGAGWINAARFQSAADITGNTIRAKVAAIAGQYKCAIYSDNNGRPDRLLGITAEVSNPDNGWQSFPLISSVALVRNQYYWFAIWSNSGQAKVYYSGNNGSLVWVSSSYGPWPDPLSTSGSAAVNYCIYATGLAAGPPPTLASITATPVDPTILSGATQQFTATGTYSDGSTQNLTGQAAWASLNDSVATINTAGLATGRASGAATITATFSGVTGSTTLTVQTAPLAITTSSMPNGTLNTAYSATLAAAGGTPPYTWSLAGGALPPGLSLGGGSGAITGIPTASGDFSFTAGVSDASSPVQSVTRNLSIAISSASLTLGNTNEGTLLDTIGAGWINAGRFQATANLTLSGLSAKVTAITGRYKCAIYSDSGGLPSGLLGSSAELSNPATGWRSFPLASPVTVTAGQYYWLAIWSDTKAAKVYYTDPAGLVRWGSYSYGAWPNTLATSGSASINLCIYATGASSGPPPTLASIAVTPVNPTLLSGATQQFIATATYSDGSAQNVTSQATWHSSNDTAATINTSGLATARAGGDSTITATFGGLSGSSTLTVQAAPLAITTTSLPNGTLNTAYSATLAATGGTLPYTWSLAAGALPPGLLLNGGSGAITGMPTMSGNFSFTAGVSDMNSPVQSVTRDLSIAISSAPLTFGNTNEGTLLDTIGANWINAGRFQATANLALSSLSAKVAAITGRYKCAIYGDSGGLPGTLLRATAQISNPAAGWHSFPLTSPLAVTAGQYYWLAIWSDTRGAKIYYTDTLGSLRWGSYSYGAWPGSLATSGSANINLCLYATGTPSAQPLTAVAPAEPVILSIEVIDNLVTISWTANHGASYVLEYSDGIDNPIWVPLSSVVATGSTVTLTDAMGDLRQRFYRVSVSD